MSSTVPKPIHVMPNDASDLDQPPCKLLELPTELLVWIVEYSLSPDDKEDHDGINPAIIHISANLKLPALFSVNRRIRQEAIPIWLEQIKQNELHIEIWFCNASVLLKWHDLLRTLMPRPKGIISALHPIKHLGGALSWSWANLVQWCRWIHEGRLRTPDVKKRDFEVQMNLGDGVQGAFEIVRRFRRRGWGECEKALEDAKEDLLDTAKKSEWEGMADFPLCGCYDWEEGKEEWRNA